MCRVARGLNCIKYYFSHLVHYFVTMTSWKLLWSSVVPFVGSLPDMIVVVALGFGLYVRFMFTLDAIVLVFILLGLFVFATSLACVYYFSMATVGGSLMRLWLGCVVGVVAFTSRAEFEGETPERTMNVLLMVGVGVQLVWNVAERLAGMSTGPVTMDSLDYAEMLGMVVACNTQGRDFVPVGLLVVAFAFSLVAIRLKSFVAVLNLLCLALVTSLVYFPQLVHTHVNPYPLMCFAGRMTFAPILDLYFSKLTMLERWRTFLCRSRVVHRLAIVGVVGVDASFYAAVAAHTPSHKEWYVVVPIFATFSVVWFSYHVVFVVTCWQLAGKIADCNATYRSLASERRNMSQIMASKGVRHFGLITGRLSLVTFVSTVVLALVGWETKTALTMSLLFLVTPLELTVTSLLGELGSVLGGTCIGYAIVAPAVFHRPGDSITVLPPSAVQELGHRATHILNSVQAFFSHHLVDNFGCDYSSSGLALGVVESKLRTFFQRQTTDGPRFDTYLLYYSGHVHENGDWALAEETTMTFQRLVELWREYNTTSGARLVLVLDSVHSFKWLRQVAGVHDEFVAIQTCKARASHDAETPETFRVGDFTSEWTAYNCDDAAADMVDWGAQRPMYGVSRRWTDFAFHLPTRHDIAQHWSANFPRATLPLIKATNFPRVGGVSFCCDCVLRCVKRARMQLLPPAECDTGHGFRLIRSR